MEEISPYNLDNLEVIPKKYRCFTFVCYEDSTIYNFKDVLANLKTYKNWAYIKHLPESNEKKTHYHFIIKLDILLNQFLLNLHKTLILSSQQPLTILSE